MSLFLDYQIPSGLLSFDGPNNASVSKKVESIKRNVAAVMDVIHKEKAKQLQAEKNKEEMRKAKNMDVIRKEKTKQLQEEKNKEEMRKAMYA